MSRTGGRETPRDGDEKCVFCSGLIAKASFVSHLLLIAILMWILLLVPVYTWGDRHWEVMKAGQGHTQLLSSRVSKCRAQGSWTGLSGLG